MSSNIRIGQGFDVHAFGDGDHVMLGGVRIDSLDDSYWNRSYMEAKRALALAPQLQAESSVHR